jgi:hypothetical protein
VQDKAEGKYLEANYTDEPMAVAGAQLAAACDIRALFDPPR